MSTRNDDLEWPATPATLALRFWQEQYREGVRIDALDGQLVFTLSIPDPILRVQKYGVLKYPSDEVEIDFVLQLEAGIHKPELLALLDHKSCPDILVPHINQIVCEREYENHLMRLAEKNGVLIAAYVAPYGWRTAYRGKRRVAKK